MQTHTLAVYKKLTEDEEKPWNGFYPPLDEDYCDCDERCKKCGKKKRRNPWKRMPPRIIPITCCLR